ncbi:MAG: cysteine desulfurase family protein [Candidatus Altiarchaeota archaeon]
MKVYLDHGATTPVDPAVVEAMLPFYGEKFGNASSLHGWGREAKSALEDSREKIASRINASPEEIIFTSGGSESDNLALKGIAYSLRGERNHIVTSKIEHPAVLETARFLEKDGFKVTYLGVDGQGFIDLGELEDALMDKTVLVSIMHANNEIGTIQDLEAIGGICADKNVLLHTDAVQSFTKVPIDVEKQNVSLASFSAHKIHGPKGVGALYVRKDVKKKLLKQIHGGHHEGNLRAGTENIPGTVGFAKAVELAKTEHVRYMTKLRNKLIDNLLRIDETHLNGPRGERRLCNNASISFHYIEGEGVLLHLDAKGIAVSTGSACSSTSLEPSHVLTAIGLKPEVSHGTIRFTLGRENTEKEIDYTTEAVKEVVEKLRKISPLMRKK